MTNAFNLHNKETVLPPCQTLQDRVKNSNTIGPHVFSDLLVETPIVLRVSKGFYPELPKDTEADPTKDEHFPVYGPSELYLHVYGIHKTFYVELKPEAKKDQKLLENLLRVKECTRMMRECLVKSKNSYLSKTFLGAKLVYKKPPHKSVLGETYMIKLYFNSRVSTNTLKTVLYEHSSIVQNRLYNCVIPNYTSWMIANKTCAYSQMWIQSEVEPTTRTFKGKEAHEKYNYIDVFYKDIKYDNDSRFDMSDFDYGPLFDLIEEQVLKPLTEEAPTMMPLYLSKRPLRQAPVPRGKEVEMKELKKAILDYMFAGTKRMLPGAYLNGNNRSQHVSELHGLYRNGVQGVMSEEAQTFMFNLGQHALVVMMKMQHMISHQIKNFWKNEVYAKLYGAEQRERQDMLLMKIGKRQRVCALDIETHFIPHSNDDTFIISMHTTLYNAAYTKPIENVHHMLLHQDRDSEDSRVNVDEVCDDVQSQLGNKFNANLQPGKNMFINYYTSQKDLLTGFFDCVRKWQVRTITSYNGDSFDLPMIQLQCEREKLFGCREYRYNVTADEDEIKIKRRMYDGMSFCERMDSASIAYKKGNKVADSKRKSNAVKKFLERRKEEVFADVPEKDAVVLGDEEEDEFFDPELGVSMDVRMQEMAAKVATASKHTREQYNHMLNAWQIHTLCTNNVGHRDVMKTVQGNPLFIDASTPYNKTLDCVAYGYLQLKKLHCEEVSYSNMAETWRYKNLKNLIVYCMIDTLLVVALDKLFMNELKDILRVRRVFKPMRELYGNKTQENTLCMMYSYMWPCGIVSYDPNVNKNEDELWEPDHVYDNDRDFGRMQARAGRTLTASEGVYNDHPTTLVDFAAQYSAIMSRENIDPSTMVEEKDLKPHWKEGVHYKVLRVPNALPRVFHACPEDSPKCTYKTKKQLEEEAKNKNFIKTRVMKEYASRCKWDFKYVPVYKDVYIVTPLVMEGTARQLASDLREERAMYKKLMKSFPKGSTMYVIYDNAQLDAKLAGNSIYGIELRISGEAGGLITAHARRDIERATIRLCKTSGPSSMCDTDSTSSINKRWSLRPCPIPPNRVSDEKLSQFYEEDSVGYRKILKMGPFKNPDELPGDAERSMDPTPGALNRLSKFLYKDEWEAGERIKITQIFKKAFDFYEQIMDEINNGAEGIEAMWDKPSSLEIEKLMIGLNFPCKKMYGARMIEPGSCDMTTIVRGFACKKADKTKIKGLTQLGSVQMISENDFRGFARYCTDLYSIMFVALRSRLIAQARIDELVKDVIQDIDLLKPGDRCEDIKREIKDDEDLMQLKKRHNLAKQKIADFDRQGMEEKIIKKFSGERELVTDADCFASEKVNNPHTPKTVADKRERNRCKRTGENKYNMYTKVLRGPSVQVGSHLMTMIDTLLIRPPTSEQDLHIVQNHERECRQMTLRQYDSYLKRKATSKAKAEAAAEAFTPLKITDMPEHLKPHKEFCVEVDMRTRLQLLEQYYNIDMTSKMIAKEANEGFAESKLIAPLPELFTNHYDLERALKRMKRMREEYTFFAWLLPLFWYDDTYCLTEPPVTEEWFTLQDVEVCVSFWSMYMKTKKRYVFIDPGVGQEIKLKLTDCEPSKEEFTQYSSENCYLFRKDIVKLADEQDKRFKVPGKLYLDMAGDYALQTQSTPLLAVSSNGKLRCLINKGSYCNNSKNRFGFRVESHILDMAVDPLCKIASFKPVPGKAAILINEQEPELPVTFIRDDEREVYEWPFEDQEPIKINMDDLRRKYLHDFSLNRHGYNCSMTDFVFNDDAQRLEVRNRVGPATHCFAYETGEDVSYFSEDEKQSFWCDEDEPPKKKTKTTDCENLSDVEAEVTEEELKKRVLTKRKLPEPEPVVPVKRVKKSGQRLKIKLKLPPPPTNQPSISSFFTKIKQEEDEDSR